MKDNRAANIVVSGLPPVPQVADQVVVADLCRDELGIVSDIASCRRLGKDTSGKVQPLLVVLRSADQADQILARAKSLRKSPSSVIKDHVFINRHMTAAQSRAAFELRCQRRSRKNNKNESDGSQSSEGSTAAVAAAAGGSKPGQNASAAEFKMPSSLDSAAGSAAGSN